MRQKVTQEEIISLKTTNGHGHSSFPDYTTKNEIDFLNINDLTVVEDAVLKKENDFSFLS